MIVQMLVSAVWCDRAIWPNPWSSGPKYSLIQINILLSTDVCEFRLIELLTYCYWPVVNIDLTERLIF
jgi:hypothetical protein